MNGTVTPFLELHVREPQEDLWWDLISLIRYGRYRNVE